MNEPTMPLASHLQRLHELFDRLIDRPAGERDAELARIAAEAPELADDLRGLLEHAARSDSPLDSAAVRLAGDSEPDCRAKHVDRTFGDSNAAKHDRVYHARGGACIL